VLGGARGSDVRLAQELHVPTASYDPSCSSDLAVGATGAAKPGPRQVSESELANEGSVTTSPTPGPEEAAQPVHRDDDAHDAEDAELLRKLAELRASVADPEREREIIAELIGGWEPLFRGWLVSRIGRQDGEDVGEIVVVRLVALLKSGRKMTAAWGACVWTIVRDEAYRYYRWRERSKERLVAEVYADPDDAPAEDPFEDIDPARDAARLTALVKQLSERDQQVIQLTVIEERPRREAAKVLGLTVNALNQARHRAVRNLAELAHKNGVSGNGDTDEESA